MLRLKDNIELNTTGNAATATKATQDSSGNTITSTYIKSLSVNGKTITYTKGDNTTGTITTQDTVYTLPIASTGVNGTLGGIRVGSGLSIDSGTGVLSATGEGTTAENVEWSGVLNKPTKVSYWTNDANYITLNNVMAGATASTAGKAGVVPAPGSGSQAKFLRGDGQWATVAEATKATQDGSGNTITSTYVKKAGDSMSGILTIGYSEFGALFISRTGSTNAAAIGFRNSNGTLGYLAMATDGSEGFKRWDKDINASYTILDTGNYSNTLDTIYVKKTGDTMTGSLHLANNVSNKVGDDVSIGDFNLAGKLGILGLNGTTGISLIRQAAAWSTASERVDIVYNHTDKCIEFNFA